MRDFVNAFNDRRTACVEPGERLVVDESMSANRTNRTTSNNYAGGLPHQTKIARKPEGVGVEIRNCIASDSLIMMRLEIQESKEEMGRKRYVDAVESKGTACVLRLTEPWQNTGRIVYGDSAFASVWTAVNLRQRGLNFIGLVKTASKEYPMKYFKGQPIAPRSGVSLYLKANRSGHQLNAVGWYDKTIKTIISTVGGSGSAPSHARKRYAISNDGTSVPIEKITPISLIPFDYFSNAQKIDVHNHRRQGILGMERAIQTHSWVVRLICTILGIIMVDAYMMYSLEKMSNNDDDNSQSLSFNQFVEIVAVALASNNLNSKKRRVSSGLDDNEEDVEVDQHNLGPLKDHPSAAKIVSNKKQRRCKECGDLTSYICIKCSSLTSTFSLCSSRGKRGKVKNCHVNHISKQNS